jgi:serine/threonine protein kinase
MVGGSLDALLASERRLSWEERVQICIDAGRGMAYIHSENRVHRDLKSPNLLVSELGTVKVADFGQIGDELKVHGRILHLVPLDPAAPPTLSCLEETPI